MAVPFANKYFALYCSQLGLLCCPKCGLHVVVSWNGKLSIKIKFTLLTWITTLLKSQ